MSYKKIKVEHWCSNILCKGFCKDPDSNKGVRYILTGDLALEKNRCIWCHHILTSELDVKVQELVEELKIKLPF